jgi:hypothetical protein
MKGASAPRMPRKSLWLSKFSKSFYTSSIAAKQRTKMPIRNIPANLN